MTTTKTTRMMKKNIPLSSLVFKCTFGSISFTVGGRNRRHGIFKRLVGVEVPFKLIKERKIQIHRFSHNVIGVGTRGELGVS